ncbi:hypothetical protein [Armatimonas sp.]|uniref:hypothetical protein n=1 Tax=Armatimonas sp. TaxID=1872638 RepID=UPI0037520EA6
MSDASEGKTALDSEELPARADRDRFPTLASKIGDVDKTCLGCLAGVGIIVVTVLLWALVWYLRTPEVQQKH